MNSCRKGLGYIYVIFTFLIITVLLTSVLSIFLGNLKQAKYQERKVQAYYLALSGIDIATAALQQKNSSNPTSNQTIMDSLFSTSAMKNADSTIYLEQKNLSLTDGTVYIKISAFDKYGNRWIKVLSTGTLSGSNVSQTVTMCFPINNKSQRIWDNK